MVTILIMSAKLATPGNKAYDVIILLRDSDYIVDMIM